MFVTGCGADQNPHPRREVKYARQHGRTLATAVEAAVTANPQPLQGRLRYDLDTVLLDRAGGDQAPFPYPIQRHAGRDAAAPLDVRLYYGVKGRRGRFPDSWKEDFDGRLD